MANKVPAKIDVGPVYNVDPQRRKAYTGKLPLVLFVFIARGMETMLGPLSTQTWGQGSVDCRKDGDLMACHYKLS